jgi:hypothetical protein
LTPSQARTRLDAGEEGKLVVHPKGLGPPLDGLLRSPPRHLSAHNPAFFIGPRGLLATGRRLDVARGRTGTGERRAGRPWK